MNDKKFATTKQVGEPARLRMKSFYDTIMNELLQNPKKAGGV